MNVTVYWLLVLLVLPFCSSLPRLSERGECLLENHKLRQKLKALQDVSQLYEFQLKDLLGNNYHRQTSKIFSSRQTEQKDLFLPTTSGSLLVYNQDCAMVFRSGKRESAYYRIRPRADREPFLVYCDMSDGGGWTMIQRRSNGKENFYRKWDDYKEGFGRFQCKNDEYWLGNDKIYDLLFRGENSLKIDLMDWHGESRYAIYEDFQMSNEMNNYRIGFGTFSGTAGDALSGGSSFDSQWSASLHGMPFSTPDRDNDRFLAGNCAEEHKCGWWFNRCHAANLNGLYHKTGNYTGPSDNGVVWSTWRGLWYSLKYTAMKVRHQSFVDGESGDGETK
ncbi:fibrinogen-like protein 1 [Varanus komodoensis]|uniref:Fibrinogen C-terminal domain-containing protein n=1 Tax=Varanus komodoensis TaxID=61221 RepID=A0A8D2KWP8_VARKO|nr:fibrinogen-like protein 1 [Varanus komodoensis]XP_044300189.1 fibrinogen-like protein 1 [Varanus komodoensis]XP_044300190.1 fibrinogen-like protein 1 [Varanus komodoensis]XP_044300191.1 fibrinogen-like protein 1 [Varanus komodoensis]XP_044300193.1 fibrinogen-like protein 1 [Varanus komodoensis]